MVFHGNEEEAVAMADFPPAGHIGQVHGGIAAAVETENQRHGTVVEQAVVVIGKVADLVGLRVFDGPVVGRGIDDDAAGVLGHAQGFEIGLQLDLSAPHFEVLHEGVKVRFIIRFVLDQQVLAAVEGAVDFSAVADAEDGNVLALHIRHHAEPLHGAHGGGDFTGAPEVFALQGFSRCFAT